ncbi:DAPG hydrolase family protein [Rhizobium sp. BR 314]|uniref:DAPG hydrolase family protein n=1 Tax=Rhizobium sp. BR 314 TaxID=3040013 RepID=UPI0039BFD628
MRFENANDLLNTGYLKIESGVVDYDDGFKTVCAYTRMTGCKAKMVDWWFGWLGGTDQYKLWHPRDHVFSDWENRQSGTYIGSSHLVHEYLGGDDGPLFKLRINFRDPHEFFDQRRYAAFDGTAVCARIGSLEQPVNLGRMTHFVRNTDFGCEMRSRFFLGHIESRDPDHDFSEEEKASLRRELVTEDLARRLHQHATEEMGYLGELLPVFYRQVTGDVTV